MRLPQVKNEVREKILDVSQELMARYGYKRMTIEDIAEEAHIGKGSVYLHFRSKEEIAIASVDRVNERLRASLTEIACSSVDPVEKLKRMTLERVLFRMDSLKDHYRCLDENLAAMRPQLNERKAAYYAAEAEIFATVIQEGQASGEFAPGEPKKTAYSLIYATNGFMPFSLTSIEIGDPDQVSLRVLSVFELILNGIAERKE